MTTSGLPLLSRNSQTVTLTRPIKSKLILLSAMVALFTVILVHGYISGVAVAALTFAVLPAFIIVFAVVFVAGYCNISKLIESILLTWILIPGLMYLLGWLHIDTLIANAFGNNTTSYKAMFSFIRASLLEELLKYIVVLIVLMLSIDKKESRLERFAVISVCAGASFAVHENIQYVYGSSNEIALTVGIMRAVTTTPLHTFCTMIAGMTTARLLNSNVRIAFAAILSLISPVLLHGAYDMIVLSFTGRQAVIGSFIVLSIIVVVAELMLTDSKNDDSNEDQIVTVEEPSINNHPFPGALIV